MSQQSNNPSTGPPNQQQNPAQPAQQQQQHRGGNKGQQQHQSQPAAFMAQQMFMPQMHQQMPMDPNQIAMINQYVQQQMQKMAASGAQMPPIMGGQPGMPMMPGMMPPQMQMQMLAGAQGAGMPNPQTMPQQMPRPAGQGAAGSGGHDHGQRRNNQQQSHYHQNQRHHQHQSQEQTQSNQAADMAQSLHLNKAQIGPKTSLTAECKTHAGMKVIFQAGAGNNTEDMCEKCFMEQQTKSRAEARNQAQEKVSAQASDDLLSRLKEPAQPLQVAADAEEDEVEEPLSEKDQVLSLHKKIETLCQALSQKIHKKHEGLYLNHQHFGLYESTLNEKYQPVFTQMKDLIEEKRVDYMNYLKRQLLKNDETVRLERAALEKLQGGLQQISERFRADLDKQMALIKAKEKEEERAQEEAKRLAEEDSKDDGEEKAKDESKVEAKEESKEEAKTSDEQPKQQVDSAKISALNKMLDDFENILTKNFCQFANYEDFSFAKSRTTEQLQEQFFQFFDQHFQGDFRIKNQFLANVIPRLYFPQQGSKFIHCFKILNNISQIVNIQNQFSLPERSRCVVSQDGICYMFGGYLPQLKAFMSNTFILDEHRSTLVALQPMKQGRADHALILEGDQIYILGGMSYKANGGQASGQVQSLNTCEVYSIEKDVWTEMEPFEHARQQHAVCQFNEKFLFIFGGKRLKSGKANINGTMPYEFVQEVEVYEIEKKVWRTLNYISEPQRLAVISPGVTQLAGSQIMIFGGVVPAGDEQSDSLEDSNTTSQQHSFTDNGSKVKLSAQNLILDVTVGSIKHGPELAVPSYFISGGYKMLHSNQVFAFGLGLPPSFLQSAAQGLASDGESEKPVFNYGATQHKKIIHCYKATETKWLDMNETFFGGNRRESHDFDD